MCDELRFTSNVSDDLWAEVERQFSVKERVDLVATIGQYTLVCICLNSFGVQVEAGVEFYVQSPEFRPDVFPRSVRVESERTAA